jgi:hypothetical protein
MRKQVRRARTSSFKAIRQFRVVSIIAAVFVFAIGAAALSRQANSSSQKGSPAVENSAHAKYLTVRFADQNIPANNQVGQVRPLTQEEAQKLAEGIKKLINRSSDGLKSVQHSDGSVSMDLQGHFQNVALARKNDDGSVSQSCVDNPESAAAFFGIDPQLVGIQRGVSSASPKPDSERKDQ